MFNNGLYPYINYGNKAGFLSALKKINWGNFLTNTQKTLGVINQAIPIVYQVKPIWNNTKTIFKIMGAIKDDDKPVSSSNNQKQYTSPKQNQIITNNNTSNQTNNNNQPNFFL